MMLESPNNTPALVQEGANCEALYLPWSLSARVPDIVACCMHGKQRFVTILVKGCKRPTDAANDYYSFVEIMADESDEILGC